MDKKELFDLIKTGEGYTLEFKERMPDDIGRDICAFANSAGGKILLGVKDTGEVIGFTLTNHIRSQIQDIARKMDPPFSVVIDRAENVPIILVHEGAEKPYCVGGRFYIRIGSNTQQMNRKEIKEFFHKEGLILFDQKPNKEFVLDKDFDDEKFKRFCEKAGISSTLHKRDVLTNLSLLDGVYLKNAGVLFFCHRITKFFFSGIITCVLYEGTSKKTILDKKDFDADLFSNFENAFTYVCSKLNTQYIIQKERLERLELPKDALREAIINALAHRDYFSQGHIQMDIFFDRVEISNPGGLVSGLTKADLGKWSMPRNPLIMDLLLRMRLVERIGSGIKRIRETMEEYGLPVVFEVSEHWFSVIFRRKVETSKQGGQKGGQKGGQILSERQKQIVALIGKKPTITREELCEALKINSSAVQKHMVILKKGGLIKRVGPDKGGHWEVV